MNAKHTPEPWVLNESDNSISKDGVTLAVTYDLRRDNDDSEEAANAHRVVACVNACAGISTEQLEQSHRNSAVTKLVDQNNELQAENAALKEQLAEAQISAERYRWHVKLRSQLLGIPEEDLILELDDAISEAKAREAGK